MFDHPVLISSVWAQSVLVHDEHAPRKPAVSLARMCTHRAHSSIPT